MFSKIEKLYEVSETSSITELEQPFSWDLHNKNYNPITMMETKIYNN